MELRWNGKLWRAEQQGLSSNLHVVGTVLGALQMSVYGERLLQEWSLRCIVIRQGMSRQSSCFEVQISIFVYSARCRHSANFFRSFLFSQLYSLPNKKKKNRVAPVSRKSLRKRQKTLTWVSGGKKKRFLARYHESESNQRNSWSETATLNGR